ncbi:hypothetical protein [Canibacter zhoujuaniae]|uniref:hypothetical protein n=1 Tax=Canibacter zhoujuaniae TaxID=2708343 RepID=UPI001423D098|nr:hypothetical protein [Canibacter zhoujuaniae]
MDTSWKPVSFSYAWWGHLITGFIVGVCVLIASAVVFWLLPYKMPVHLLIIIVGLSVVICETLSTTFDLNYARKKKHNSPGGWLPIFAKLFLLASIYFAASYVLTGSLSSAGIIVLIAIAVELVFVVLLRAWKPGMNDEEVRQAWRDTAEAAKRVMTEN